jgi:hypothetical protein
MREKEKTVLPRGVMATLSAGFDLTAKHMWLILLPVVLDLFYWLGPRLSFRQLVEQMVSFWQQQSLLMGIDADLLLDLAPRTNLFTSLSLPLVGVPAFVVGLVPEKTPLPTRIIELDSVWVWALLLVAFSLLGLLLTALYYGLIASVVRQQATKTTLSPAGTFLHRLLLSWLQLIALVVLFSFALLIVYVPLLLVSSMLSLFSGSLATIMLLVMPMIAIWLLFYLSLAPHGLVLYSRPLWRAVIESVRLIRGNLLSAMGLVIVLMVISRVMDWLLLVAEDGSWFTLFSIMGHAFVSTALVVATFLFYRDRYFILNSIVAERE